MPKRLQERRRFRYEIAALGLEMIIMRTVITLAVAAALAASPVAAKDKQVWLPTWFAPSEPVADAPAMLGDTTVRQIVHTSAGGDMVRVRVSNAFGATALHIDNVAIATRTDGANVVAGSSVPLTFAGKADVTVPAGAYMLSDPVPFTVVPQSDLAVSIHVAGPAPVSTVHLQQRNAIYYAAGDATAAETFPTAAPPSQTDWTPWLSEVEVAGSKARATLVVFGDSITDGAGPAKDSNQTWPDLLYDRFRKAGIKLSIANAGISGNRLLHNGAWVTFGVNGVARFDTDVLAQPGVKAVIVLIGINDIGHPGSNAPLDETTPPEVMETGLMQLAARAHEHGLKIYAATMTPFKDTVFENYYSDAKEAQRQAVNTWIRSNTVFDGYADLDRALDDPVRPGHMRPEYDSGDHLHPSAAGDAAIAAAIPLEWFR